MTIETPEDYLSSRSHKRPADSPPVQPPLPPARRQGVFTQLHLEAVRGPTVEPEISTGLPELAPNISMNTLERCWVCHKTKGLKLAHLLSTNINSRYRVMGPLLLLDIFTGLVSLTSRLRYSSATSVT
jgi:hypothetical protein